MELKNINTNPAKTVLTVCVGILVFYFFSKLEWLLYTALIIGIIGVFSTYLSMVIDNLWMKLAWLLSYIFPTIMLSLVFFLIVFPLAILYKLFSRTDNLMLKNRKESLLMGTNKLFTKTSFEKPW